MRQLYKCLEDEAFGYLRGYAGCSVDGGSGQFVFTLHEISLGFSHIAKRSENSKILLEKLVNKYSQRITQKCIKMSIEFEIFTRG